MLEIGVVFSSPNSQLDVLWWCCFCCCCYSSKSSSEA